MLVYSAQCTVLCTGWRLLGWWRMFWWGSGRTGTTATGLQDMWPWHHHHLLTAASHPPDNQQTSESSSIRDPPPVLLTMAQPPPRKDAYSKFIVNLHKVMLVNVNMQFENWNLYIMWFYELDMRDPATRTSLASCISFLCVSSFCIVKNTFHLWCFFPKAKALKVHNSKVFIKSI